MSHPTFSNQLRIRNVASNLPDRVSRPLVVSVSAAHAIGRGFTPRAKHRKDHHKNGTNCLPTWHEDVRVEVGQCEYVKDRAVCDTVSGKDLLESIVRVWYCITVP